MKIASDKRKSYQEEAATAAAAMVPPDTPVPPSPRLTGKSEKNTLSGFNSKDGGKPTPWDGENEEEYKSWDDQFLAYMACAGDKMWKDILKKIKEPGE